MTFHEVWLALVLMVVIEGMVYALFPRGVKGMMVKICGMPDDAVRIAGLLFATIGVAFLWILVKLG